MSKAANNQQKLLEAGLTLLCTKKPEEISMDEVASIAGVTKPMVYYYFGSKAGFYQKLVRHIETVIEEMVGKCLYPGVSFRDALKNLIVLRIEQTVTHPEMSNGVRILATSQSICGIDSRGRIVALFSRLKPIFQEAITRGEIRRDTNLQLTMGMMNSLMEGARRIYGADFLKNVEPEVFADEIIRMVFNGIGTGERTDQ